MSAPCGRALRVGLTSTLALLAVGCAPERAPSSDEERTSYAVGLHLGARLRAMGVEVAPDEIVAGMTAAAGNGGAPPAGLDVREVELELASLAERARERRRDAASAGAARAGAAADETRERARTGQEFLAVNRTRPGVIELPSGIQYRVLEGAEAGAAPPALGDRVTVEYEGRLLDGAVFDTSRDRFAPTIVRLARTPRPWRSVLPLVPGGATVEMWVPADADPTEHPVGLVPPGEVVAFTVRVKAIDRHERPDVARGPP